jgi:hypothetical protein
VDFLNSRDEEARKETLQLDDFRIDVTVGENRWSKPRDG